MTTTEPIGERHGAEQQLGVLQLIWSDYDMHCDMAGEARRTRLLKLVPRMLMNTSLRAQVLVRLACAAPRNLHWVFRSLLTALHGSEVVYGARIGPRLHLPHPYGIGIGGQVRIGTGVTICQNVTLGSDMAARGQPVIGDHAVVLAGAVAVGPITIGDGAVVGANVVLEEDLVPGGLAAPAKARIVNRRINWPSYPVAGRDPKASP